MLIDSLATFLETGDMSKAVGTENLGDVIDLFVKGTTNLRNVSNGHPLWVVWTVTTAPTNASATFQLKVVSDAQDPVTTDDTETTHALSPVFTQAEIPQGFVYGLALPKGGKNYERFLGVQLVTAGGAETAMIGDVHLTPYAPIIWEAYQDAENDD